MCIIGCVYRKLAYVAVNVANVHYSVSVLEIGVYGCKGTECALGVCVLEIGVGGCNVRSMHYKVCVLEIVVCGCKYGECALYGLCTANYFMIQREKNRR